MKILIPCLALAGTSFFLSSCSEPPANEEGTEDASQVTISAQPGFEILFNGKDLTGWKGNPDNWKVENGVIVGTTTEEAPLPYNQFLIWEGAPLENFELTAELKLISDGNNSGIQYRAEVRPDLGDYVVSGYQCDMHPAIWANGMLYEEKGRGILCKRGMKAVITPEGKAKQVGDLPMEPEFVTADWNTYKITAQGNHIVHEVNGVQTVDVYDHHEDERDLAGVLAFQIHKGPAMRVEIRNIALKRLPSTKITSPDQTPVPADAPDVHPPKKKAAPKAKGPGKAAEKAKAAPAAGAPKE